MNLRKAANGLPCQLRFRTVCNFNPETSVLCHVATIGTGIMGGKPPDASGCIGCGDCHNFLDHRDLSAERRILRMEMIKSGEYARTVLDGILRTHQVWVEEGLWSRK